MYIFYFPLAENKKIYIYIYNEKGKKKLVQKFELGYYPIVLQVEWVLKIVLQYNFCIADKKA